LPLARETGDLGRAALLLNMLGFRPTAPEQAREYTDQALACYRQVDDRLGIANSLSRTFSNCMHADRIEEGQSYLAEAIAIAEELDATLFLYFLHNDLAIVLLIEGRYLEAVPLVRRNLLISRRVGPGMEQAMWLFVAACCAGWQDPAEIAARLHGAADAAIEAALALGTIGWSPPEQRLRETEQARLRERMGDAAYEAAAKAGARLSPAQAIELALGRDVA
jgi:tetratricopeptide (TPR) repeat protein